MRSESQRVDIGWYGFKENVTMLKDGTFMCSALMSQPLFY